MTKLIGKLKERIDMTLTSTRPQSRPNYHPYVDHSGPGITRFRGPTRWLSNFHEAPVSFEGAVYPTTEHAFQAAKTLDLEDRVAIQGLPTPAAAKKAGRLVPLRKDWEAVKLDVMYQVNLDKFRRHPELRAKLLATKECELVEGNPWNDRYWGVDEATGEGQNHLGKILMLVRESLRVRFHHFRFSCPTDATRLSIDGHRVRVREERTACTLAIRHWENGTCNVGMAICSKRDQFSRAAGRECAYFRLDHPQRIAIPAERARKLILALRSHEKSTRGLVAPHPSWFFDLRDEILGGGEAA